MKFSEAPGVKRDPRGEVNNLGSSLFSVGKEGRQGKIWNS
jgi:hypothetical protein